MPDFDDLIGRFREVAQKSLVKDINWKGNLYSNVFVGAEAVDWLCGYAMKDACILRSTATEIGEKMRKTGLFSHHVYPEHAFEDEFHFYRFNPDFRLEKDTKPPVSPVAVGTVPFPALGPTKSELELPQIQDKGRKSPQPPTSTGPPRANQTIEAKDAHDWLQLMRRPSIIRASAPKQIMEDGSSLVLVVLGASGDLAHKKTFPALFGALYSGHMSPDTIIIGYARTKFKDLDEFKTRVTASCKAPTPEAKQLLEQFKSKLHYIDGQYDQDESFQKLNDYIASFEPKDATHKNRIFYLALPPSVFIPVTKQLKEHCYAQEGWNRVVVEKPFGKDLDSSNELAHAIGQYWSEQEIYRIDHYLGKEMVKNIVVLRFTNRFVGGIWSREHIDNVQITFKENFGTEGRGGYFDEFGIIRDVMQNHLMQVLTLITMEKPVTFDAEDVRNEKVKVLKYIPPINWSDVMVGQYIASRDGSKPGYKDDATVPKDSVTPTWAVATLWVCNERWDGVPFIFKAGKALNESKAEIRIQFRDVAGNTLFPNLARNELVIRIQPDEAVYIKMMNKSPGYDNSPKVSELQLTYSRRYSDIRIPDAYESLLADILRGDHSNFVRADELEEAWRIFTPILHKIEKEKIEPLKYHYGDRGPEGLEEFLERYGYQRGDVTYDWTVDKK